VENVNKIPLRMVAWSGTWRLRRRQSGDELVALHTAKDSTDLAGFGYKQVLDRTLGGFSSFAAGFSYISVLTGVFQMFYVGYGAGGPAFFWTWPAVFLGQLTVALCFAELAARYPLSGGIYQWSRSISSRAFGWMAGWVYLCGSVISLAAVALALQATLPQIAPGFQVIGDSAVRLDRAQNAVLLGCVLIALSTLINAVGIRLMARINNVGVIAELAGVALLTGLLAASIRRDPAVFFETHGAGDGQPLGYLGPFLAAALMASYVLYGFDTAGALAEETAQPRRRAPWAILQALAAAGLAGGLLIFFGILAVSDPSRPELGRITGGLPFLVKDVLGARLGVFLLVEVIFAVFVCALAVHAAAVRLMFAMARDNNLPMAHALAHVSARTRAPIVPAIVIGVLASAILILNINLPHVIEMLCSVAIVWANLAYLMVTLPLLIARLRPERGRRPPVLGRNRESSHDGEPDGCAMRGPYFSLGRFGLPINAIAVLWGLFVVINIGWPRPEIYGTGRWSRFGAPLATGALILTGATYFLLFQRKKTGILANHAADPVPDSEGLSVETRLRSNANGASGGARRSLSARFAGHGQASGTKTEEGGPTA
jgi:urea carboxylase system permease